MRRMPVKTSIVLSLVYRSDISSITTVFLACQGKSCQLVRCIVLEIIGLKYKYKIKTALKVLSFGAVFTFEPPLEESQSKIYLFL